MNMSFSSFLRRLITNPALLITALLALGVVCVNDVTDAPSAIATRMSIRSLDVNLAIAVAAICNCVGVVVATTVNSMVAMTITNMVGFGEDTSIALVTLCAALSFIVVRSSFAVSIGCPTSESHALITGLTGAVVAICGGFLVINSAEWIKVVHGLISSVVLGSLGGYFSCKLVAWTRRDMGCRKTTGLFRYTQIGGVAAMAFTHGVQDEQRFIGVMLLGVCMVNGSNNTQGVRSPLWAPLLGSAAMAPGTSIGGKRIIESVGMGMVRLEKYQGLPADMAEVVCLLGPSILGIPVSTTHTKTIAIVGVGAVKRLPAINFSMVKDMVMTRVITSPGYGVIGFLVAKLFMMLSHG